MNKKRIIVLMGGSGTGKTTLGNFLKEQGIPEIISHTTRKKRVGEVDGETYYYVSVEEFEKIDRIEEVTYNGNHYCISRAEIENKLKQSDVVFVITDKNGMEQVRENFPEITTVVYIYISLDEMERRMYDRGDSEENVRSRINYAIEIKELENAKYADYSIENKDLAVSKKTLLEIVGM